MIVRPAFFGCFVPQAGGSVFPGNLLLSPTDFSNAAWIKFNVSVSGAVLTGTSATDCYMHQDNIALLAGKVYRFAFDIRSAAGITGLRVFTNGATLNDHTYNITADWREIGLGILPPSDSSYVVYIGGGFTWVAPKTIELANLRLTEVGPAGSELLVGNSDFSQAAWVKGTVTVGLDKITLTANGGDSYVYQNVAGCVIGEAYEFSAEVRADSATSLEMSFLQGGTWFRKTITATPEWQTFRTQTVAMLGGFGCWFGAYSSFSTGEVIQVRNASLKKCA